MLNAAYAFGYLTWKAQWVTMAESSIRVLQMVFQGAVCDSLTHEQDDGNNAPGFQINLLVVPVFSEKDIIIKMRKFRGKFPKSVNITSCQFAPVPTAEWSLQKQRIECCNEDKCFLLHYCSDTVSALCMYSNTVLTQCQYKIKIFLGQWLPEGTAAKNGNTPLFSGEKEI